LQQAEDDFELKGNAALLNALSNAKRAIHAQIDEVLVALGYKVKGVTFDKKMRTFSDLGFVAPRLMKRVNRARNLLEHEYKLPTLEEVEEAIDLAGLFVSATKRHSELWEHEFTIGNEDEAVDGFSFSRQLQFRFAEKEKVFEVFAQKDVHSLEDWRPELNTPFCTAVAKLDHMFNCVGL